MAQQIIDIGVSANAGGDSLRAGMAKIAANFQELFGMAGLLGITSPLTVYVSPTGTNANSGLSALEPVQTIEYASSLVAQYFLPVNETAVIQLADGTYTGSSNLVPVTTGGLVIIRGNVASPQNVIVTSSTGPTLQVRSGCRYRLEYFEVRCTAANSQVLLATSKGYLEIGAGLRFGVCISTVDHIQATDKGVIRVVGNYVIVADTNCAKSHITVFSGSYFECVSRTVSISGSGSLNNLFIRMAYCAATNLEGTSYVVRTNLTTVVNNAIITDSSVLATGTGNTSNLPGTTNTIVSNSNIS